MTVHTVFVSNYVFYCVGGGAEGGSRGAVICGRHCRNSWAVLHCIYNTVFLAVLSADTQLHMFNLSVIHELLRKQD